MGKHEKRVRDALDELKRWATVTSYTVTFPDGRPGTCGYEVDVPAMKRRAHIALRHAVLLEGANVACEDVRDGKVGR